MSLSYPDEKRATGERWLRDRGFVIDDRHSSRYCQIVVDGITVEDYYGTVEKVGGNGVPYQVSVIVSVDRDGGRFRITESEIDKSTVDGLFHWHSSPEKMMNQLEKILNRREGEKTQPIMIARLEKMKSEGKELSESSLDLLTKYELTQSIVRQAKRLHMHVFGNPVIDDVDLEIQKKGEDVIWTQTFNIRPLASGLTTIAIVMNDGYEAIPTEYNTSDLKELLNMYAKDLKENRILFPDKTPEIPKELLSYVIKKTRKRTR